MLFNTSNSQQKLVFIAIPLFLLFLLLGQLYIPRTQFVQLVCWQVVLYSLFAILYILKQHFTIMQILGIALIARVVVACTLPTLSDDVYRFIWDGQLIAHGQNPLLTTPDVKLLQLQQSANVAYYTKLHNLINHPQFYTCYPPLMQSIFWVGSVVGGNSIVVSIVVIKLLVALIDVVGIYYLYKILKLHNLNPKLIILYALNPLVIVEGAGNAHFEVVQVALMCMAIYYLHCSKTIVGGMLWGLAIVTKLLPLMLLPMFIKYIGFKRAVVFGTTAVVFAVLTCMPFVSANSIAGFTKSLNLYFQNFEFNASIYYIARAIGWQVKGYNYISYIGPLLMKIFLMLYAILFFVTKPKSLQTFANSCLVAFTLYYFLATTVHPWYIINLLPFAIIANIRFAVVWLGAAFLSYFAYSQIPFAENLWLIGVEYSIVMVAIWYSYFYKNKSDFSKSIL